MNVLTLTKKSFLPTNALIVFDYNSKSHGSTDTRSVVVSNITDTHIEGHDMFRGGAFRKFLRSNITGDIQVWGTVNPILGN